MRVFFFKLATLTKHWVFTLFSVFFRFFIFRFFAENDKKTTHKWHIKKTPKMIQK